MGERTARGSGNSSFEKRVIQLRPRSCRVEIPRELLEEAEFALGSGGNGDRLSIKLRLCPQIPNAPYLVIVDTRSATTEAFKKLRSRRMVKDDPVQREMAEEQKLDLDQGIRDAKQELLDVICQNAAVNLHTDQRYNFYSLGGPEEDREEGLFSVISFVIVPEAEGGEFYTRGRARPETRLWPDHETSKIYVLLARVTSSRNRSCTIYLETSKDELRVDRWEIATEIFFSTEKYLNMDPKENNQNLGKSCPQLGELHEKLSGKGEDSGVVEEEPTEENVGDSSGVEGVAESASAATG